jgi:hypothetical protein
MVTDAMPTLPAGRNDVLLRRVGNEWVLFDASQGRAHVLNLTAAVVWTYCDGSHASEAIADAIGREIIDAPAKTHIRADVDQVLRRFATEGLLQ